MSHKNFLLSVWHDNCNKNIHKPIKTDTDMTISRTARVWVNEIRNKKTTHDTADYFKAIFTKEEFDEFYGELMEQTKECVKLEFQSLNILPTEPSTMNEIFAWMDEHINYFDSIDYIIDSVYTEMFQTVTGFFGEGCDDEEFEKVRDAMGDFSWGEHMEVYEYLLTEENPKVTDWKGYVGLIEGKIGFTLPATIVPNTSTNNVEFIKEKITSTELISAHIKQTGANLIYSIMNTSLYDCIGVIIVEGISPRILEDYGFGEEEIADIAKLGVGDSWNDKFMYGKGVVVVRMA